MGPNPLGGNIKTCTVCKQEKELGEFYNYKASNDGKCYRCKMCDNLARRRWSEANPERSKESQRNRCLLYKYGITPEDYNKILEDQLGMCSICYCLPDSKRVHGSFAVDHCHVTGEVRGLLCNQCNRALGMFEDSSNVLRNALQYLEDFKQKLQDTH